jgi:hypothetical protein
MEASGRVKRSVSLGAMGNEWNFYCSIWRLGCIQNKKRHLGLSSALKETFTDAFVKCQFLVLKGISGVRVSRSYSLESLFRREVEKNNELGECALHCQLVGLIDKCPVDAASMALEGDGGVDESIGEHPRALGKMWTNHLVHVLGPVGSKHEKFGSVRLWLALPI